MEKIYVHSPADWCFAWADIVLRRQDAPESALAAKLLIWLQTHSSLLGISSHHDGCRLQARDSIAVFTQQDIFRDISTPRERQIKVECTDCLEAAQSLQGVGFQKVAVLNMANKRKPGGDVKRGGDFQEEDLYRRTDISRQTERYLRGDFYPCSDITPVVMVHN